MTVISDTWTYLTDRLQLDRRGRHAPAARPAAAASAVTALLIAMLIGLPIALWLGHRGRGGWLAINISNVGRAVPTFALLAATRDGRLARHPRLRALRTGRAGDDHRPDPLCPASDHHQRLRRDARGVAGRPQQAADGMGMTGPQKFFRVELPLASPLVMSGIRLALVQVWATATIAALVAGPGLGRVITDGFYRTNYGKGIAGAIVVAVVALVLEVLAALTSERWTRCPGDPSPNRHLPGHGGMSEAPPMVAEEADTVGH